MDTRKLHQKRLKRGRKLKRRMSSYGTKSSSTIKLITKQKDKKKPAEKEKKVDPRKEILAKMKMPIVKKVDDKKDNFFVRFCKKIINY